MTDPLLTIILLLFLVLTGLVYLYRQLPKGKQAIQEDSAPKNESAQPLIEPTQEVETIEDESKSHQPESLETKPEITTPPETPLETQSNENDERLAINDINEKIEPYIQGTHSTIAEARLDSAKRADELDIESESRRFAKSLRPSISDTTDSEPDNTETLSLQFFYKLQAKLDPKTPLSILNRHGEEREGLPSEESAYFTWREPRDSFTLSSETETISSMVGPLPADGGSFMDFLKRFREIVERPIQNKETELVEIARRADEIEILSPDYGYRVKDDGTLEEIPISEGTPDYLDILSDGDNDWLYSFLLDEISGLERKGLSVSHIKAMCDQGYQSLSSILQAPDEVLLKLPRVGKKTLEKIRSNIRETA